MVRLGFWIVLTSVLAMASAGRADILRWDNGRVIPGTEGITPGPGFNFTFRDLRFAALSNFNLSASNFAVANLANADLHGANLADASFQNATLVNANLSGANLADSYLERASFRLANLRGADLTGANFIGATFTDADLTGAIVTGTKLTSTTSRGLTKEQIYSTSSYQAKDLRGISFETFPYDPSFQINDLTGWNFSSQDLAGANFYAAALESTDFSHANLTDAVFQNARLGSANLLGAEVAGANFEATTHGGLTKDQIYWTASYVAKDLRRINLSNNDLAKWDLSGQNLTASAFYSTSLTDVNLTAANLTDATFSRARLDGASLAQANLTRARFNEALLSNTNLTGAVVTGASFADTTRLGFTKEQLYSTAGYQAKNIQGIDLSSNDLSGWDLSGQDLTNARFIMANIENAHFGAAIIVGSDFSDTTSRGFGAEQLYSTASYQAKDLHAISLQGNDLTGWDFSGQNLGGADLRATLASADVAGAIIRHAQLDDTTSKGFTREQLYSTGSYQVKDLRGISLSDNDLSGWDFGGQDLTQASLRRSNLTGANLAGAVVTAANFNGVRGLTKEQFYSTATYQEKDLRGIQLGGDFFWSPNEIDLSDWDFRDQNLANANFAFSNLTNANLTGANIEGVDFGGTQGFTKEQLYSTASYQAQDLHGIMLGSSCNIWSCDYIDTNGWNLSGQNLIDATFSSSELANADFSGADLRGAFRDLGDFRNGSIIHNTILPDGTIDDLDLMNGERLLVRDDDGRGESAPEWLPPRGPVSVTIKNRFLIREGGVLALALNADPWDSLISFDPSIPVHINGTLDLTFTSDVDLTTQVGRTLQLFDWSGVSPQGNFQPRVPAGTIWDLSQLYDMGSVTLTAVHSPGDVDGDGQVNLADFDTLKSNFGSQDAILTDGDLTGEFQVDLTDFSLLKTHFGEGDGAVPEPATWLMMIVGSLAVAARTTRLSRCPQQTR